MQHEHHEPENFDAIDLREESGAPERFSRLSGIIFILLCIILIFSTLAYGATETWAFGFISIFTGLVAVFWLADAWFNREFRFETNVLQLPVIGLVLIGLIQLLPLRSPEGGALTIPAVSSLSINPYATRFAVIQLIILLVFFAAAFTYINSAQRLRKIVTVVIIFGAIMAFFGILQRLASPEGIYGWRPTPQAIPFASFVNQHHFAAFMEMTIGLTLALLVGKATEKDKRLLLIIAIVLMGIAILLTGSRGGVLSLLGVVGFVLLTNLLRKTDAAGEEELPKADRRAGFRRNLMLVGGGLGLLIVLLGAVLLLGGDAPLSRGIGFTTQADVSSGRLHFWAVGWQIFTAHPLLGAGLDAFGTAFPLYDTWNGTFRVEQAHNEYLQILADAGILGFICIAAFIFLLFKQGLQKIGAEHSHFRRSVAVGALAGCFGILIHSFFDFPLRTPSNAFFFMLFAVFVTASIHFSKRSRTRGKR